MIKVEMVEEVDEALVSAVHWLLPQLSSSAPLPSGADLERLVSSPCTTLFVARSDAAGSEGGEPKAMQRARADASAPSAQRGKSHIVGMLTLVVFFIPTGIRAWVEDVVVDGSARGQGVGEALVAAALKSAALQGAQTVDLTSRPSREAANRLYVRMGFQARETNIYRIAIGS